MTTALLCKTCQHARWRGSNVVACRFVDVVQHPNITTALDSLFRAHAATFGECAAWVVLPGMGEPDAYFAEDLPPEGA